MAHPQKNKLQPLPADLSPLGPRLAYLRKVRGFTQQGLAESLGLSQKQITDYETGRVHLNDEIIVRLAIALGISTDTLLGLDEIEVPDDAPSLRFTRRLKDLEALPEAKKRAVVKILDEFLRPGP